MFSQFHLKSIVLSLFFIHVILVIFWRCDLVPVVVQSLRDEYKAELKFNNENHLQAISFKKKSIICLKA